MSFLGIYLVAQTILDAIIHVGGLDNAVYMHVEDHVTHHLVILYLIL
jgi:hypothetical protein